MTRRAQYFGPVHANKYIHTTPCSQKPPLDSAPENTNSTPPQETSAASQLEEKTTQISPHNLSQVPPESPLPRWLDTQNPADAANSQLAFLMAQRQVPQREADAQANSKDYDDLFLPRSVQSSQTGQNVQAFVHPRPPTGFYSWSPPNPPPGFHTPNALSSREADEREVPPSVPEKPQKAKQHHPSGSKAKHARAVSTPRSGSAGSSAAVVKSIGLLCAQRDQILIQRRQENDEGRQIELESQVRRIELRIQRQRRTLEGYQANSPPAQAPEKGKKDQPLLTPEHTPLGLEDSATCLYGRERPSPKVLPVAAPGPVHDGLDPALCEPAPGDRPAIPRTPIQVEASSPEARERPENEWMEVELEDAEVPLGQEEWEDDIVSEKIPNGAAQNAWWLNMNL